MKATVKLGGIDPGGPASARLVAVGTGVGVGSGVAVGTGVGVGSGVAVGTGMVVGSGVLVGGIGVSVGAGVKVGVEGAVVAGVSAGDATTADAIVGAAVGTGADSGTVQADAAANVITANTRMANTLVVFIAPLSFAGPTGSLLPSVIPEAQPPVTDGGQLEVRGAWTLGGRYRP